MRADCAWLPWHGTRCSRLVQPHAHARPAVPRHTCKTSELQQTKVTTYYMTDARTPANPAALCSAPPARCSMTTHVAATAPAAAAPPPPPPSQPRPPHLPRRTPPPAAPAAAQTHAAPPPPAAAASTRCRYPTAGTARVRHCPPTGLRERPPPPRNRLSPGPGALHRALDPARGPVLARGRGCCRREGWGGPGAPVAMRRRRTAGCGIAAWPAAMYGRSVS